MNTAALWTLLARIQKAPDVPAATLAAAIGFKGFLQLPAHMSGAVMGTCAAGKPDLSVALQGGRAAVS